MTHVTVIDTETGKETPDRAVWIAGGRIAAVSGAENLRFKTGARIIDGTDKFLIPGLWDMHVHNTGIDSTLPLYVANGVTGVRDMFGPPDANAFRAKLATKNLIAPRIYVASPIVDGSPPSYRSSIVVDTPDEARKVVVDQKAKGADFIKVYDHLSRDAYFALLEESRRQGISVAGHVPVAISAWEASAAGQKSIEHLDRVDFACSSQEEVLEGAGTSPFDPRIQKSYDAKKCARLFAEFRKNGTWLAPTLTVHRAVGMLDDPQFRADTRLRFFAGRLRDVLAAKDDPRFKDWPAERFESVRQHFAFDEKLVGASFRAGVRLLAGTDASNPYCFPGFSLHDELALLVESGVSSLGALQAATRNAAIFMGTSDRYGSVTTGKVADLVLLDADPLVDIHNTKRIAAVLVGGKVFDRAALDAILSEAEKSADSDFPVNDEERSAH